MVIKGETCTLNMFDEMENTFSVKINNSIKRKT